MKKSLIIILGIALVACGSNDKQKAESLYADAAQLYLAKDYTEAKNLLDTIHTKYPRQVDSRKRADTLLWRITIDEINRDMPAIDSTLSTLLAKAETIAKNYKFIKDDKYQTVGDYEHRNMGNASNAARSYLKPITDEQGNFRIVSNLVGRSINHRQVVAKTADKTASSVVARNEASNSYNDFGVTHEAVNYHQSEIADIIAFMQQNANEQIEITLKGDKDYSYKISKNDVKVILETYDFAQTLKEVYRVQQQKAEYTKIYNVLTLRLPKQ